MFDVKLAIDDDAADDVDAEVIVRAPRAKLTAAETRQFHDQVIAILPKLRVQALALTRHRAAAEDLVQDAVCNALSAQESFIPGTNFAAWMHRILRNRFISNLRKRRDTTDIDDVPSSVFATSAAHEDRLALKELGAAMDRLPADQREALTMIVVHGMSYEALAEATGCAVGTAKSRVFRARRQLEAWLMGEKPARNSDSAMARPVRSRNTPQRNAAIQHQGMATSN
jgi:RNA polymerase sigma-70 factor (ECF subfamily)